MTKLFQECSCCLTSFEKGRGHKLWCYDCSKSHDICDHCYRKGKREGNITDRKYKETDISPKNLEKLR